MVSRFLMALTCILPLTLSLPAHVEAVPMGLAMPAHVEAELGFTCTEDCGPPDNLDGGGVRMLHHVI